MPPLTKTALLALLCGFAWLPGRAVAADEQPSDTPPPPAKLIQCGQDTVVTFPATASKDGRYVAGWTLHALKKASKPVNWAAVDANNIDASLQPYLDEVENDTDEPPTHYEVSNGIIDLQKKTYTPLKCFYPAAPGRRNSTVSVSYSSEPGGPAHGVFMCDGKWSTNDVYLLAFGAEGIRAEAVVKALNEEVEKYLAKHDPRYAKKHVTTYLVGESSETPENKRKEPFGQESVKISFSTEPSKDAGGGKSFGGIVTVNYANGEAKGIEARENTE